MIHAPVQRLPAQAELGRGLEIYERHLGRRPEVFARWRYGLTPQLPGILHRLGFRGALHASFDEGKTPDGLQFKVRWEGLDGSAIDAIARTPLDASKPQTFLSLATKMGESKRIPALLLAFQAIRPETRRLPRFSINFVPGSGRWQDSSSAPDGEMLRTRTGAVFESALNVATTNKWVRGCRLPSASSARLGAVKFTSPIWRGNVNKLRIIDP